MLKYPITNKRVNIVLDELADEYKNLLVEAVLVQQNEFNTENISLSEIVKIDMELKERLKNRSRNHRINKISYITTMIGIIYSLIGVMFLTITPLNGTFHDSAYFPISIICIFVGFIVAIIGLMVKVLSHNKITAIKKKIAMDYEVQIINTWRIVEELIRQIAPRNDVMSLRSMINYLEQSSIITKEDIKIIYSLMHCRNDIMHNSLKEKTDTEEVRILLDRAHELVRKLSNVI